jgi:hypothetical protein
MRYLLFFIVIFSPLALLANTYDGDRYATTEGKVYRHISGQIGIAASTASWSTYTITLDGTGGRIDADSITVSSITSSGRMTLGDITVDTSVLVSTNDMVGIGTATPAYTLDVTGGVRVTSSATVEGRTNFTTYKETMSSASVTTDYVADWSLGSEKYLVLYSTTTISFTNADPGMSMTFFLEQGSNSKTVTWPTTKWAEETAPTLSTTTLRVDAVSFHCLGTNTYIGFSSLDHY